MTCADRAVAKTGYKPFASRPPGPNAPRRGVRRTPQPNSLNNHAMRFKNNIGPQVRRFRNARLWSQAKFAAKLQLAGYDISRTSVSKIENRTVFVTDRQLLFLAEALNVPVQDLFPVRQNCRLFEFLAKLERTRF